MRQEPKNWVADYLEPSLPWLRCCAVLLPALLLAGVEYQFLARAMDGNAVEASLSDKLEESNREQALRISKAQESLGTLDKEAETVLGGILRADQEAPDLRALEKLAAQASGVAQAEDVVRVRVSGTDQEYHAFVPALNQQEANTPLMRCTWISLKTTGKPFHTSALPLQVDLELAFPRVSSRPAPTVPKTGEK